MTSVFCVVADPTLNRVLDDSRYDAQERAEIRELLNDAEGSSISAELLLPRVQEAKAKHVPAQRLLAALRQEIARLEKARDILLGTVDAKKILLDDAGWQRTANLIAWGATDEEIRSIVLACVDDVEAYLEASYLFTSLVEWGLEREASVELVFEVAGSKIEPNEYPGVLEVLIKGRRLRLHPRDMVERMIQSLDEVENVHQLQRMVLNAG